MKVFKGFFFIIVLFLIASCNKDKAPRAGFIYSIDKGGVVTFLNTTSGVVDKMTWDFGDGTEVSAETTPKHRYTAAGDYNVGLTAVNGAGSHTYTETITIEAGVQLSFNDHPWFPDADGYFYARNIFDYDVATPQVFSQVRGSAIGAIYDSTNFLVSVGRVNVNGELLEHNADNSYSKQGTDSSWYFSDPSLYWSADGGNGYPAMVENVPFEFPEISGIISTEYSRSDTVFVMKLAKSVNLADSVIWILEYKGEIMAQKHTLGGVNGAVFTKADLAKVVNSGNYIAKVVAFNLFRKTYNFQRVYYTKESYTESVISVK